MLICNEKVIREARNDDVIVKEISRDGKTYCRTHIDFEDSNNIHESFEAVCARYGISLETIDNTTMKYARNPKCVGCSGCKLVDRSVSYAPLKNEDKYYQCLAGMESECLDGEEMNQSIEERIEELTAVVDKIEGYVFEPTTGDIRDGVYWRNGDGSVSMLVDADLGDMSTVRWQIVDALIPYETIMARADLSLDTTDEEFEEYGDDAYADAVLEIWGEMKDKVTFMHKDRDWSDDGMDFSDTYVATIKGVV